MKINQSVRIKYTFWIIICSFLFTSHLAYSQKNKKELNELFCSLDSAYESYNWEKLINVGKKIEVLNEKITLKKEDSLLVIAALDAKYKMAIAYTWMNRADLAEIIVTKKFNDPKALFPLHKNYLNYYKTASESVIRFISNNLNKGEGDFLSPYQEVLSHLLHNNQVYSEATINLVSQHIATNKPKHAIPIIIKALFHFEHNKASQKQIAELYYFLYRAYLADENYALALETSLKSLNILEKANLKTSYLYAKVATAVGISYFHMQEIYISKEYFHKSLELNLSFDDKINSEIALIYDYLGKVYLKRKNLNLAFAYKKRSYEYYSRAYSEKHRMTIQLGCSFSGYFNTDKTQTLIDPLLFERINFKNYAYGLWSTENSFKNTSYNCFYGVWASGGYMREGRIKDAIVNYINALNNKLKEDNGKNNSKLSLYFQYLAALYSLNHQMDSANLYFRKALNMRLINPLKNLEEIDSEGLEKYEQSPYLIDLFAAIVHYYLTMVEEEKVDDVKRAYLQALDYCQKCENLSDIYWEKMNNQEDKLYLKKQMNNIYNQAIDISFKLKELSGDNSKEYLNKAFIFSQKSKTNVLEEMAFISGLNKKLKLPDDILAKDLRLRNKIGYWERKISQRTQTENENNYFQLVKEFEFNKGMYSDSLLYYIKEHNEVVDYLKKKYPQYYNQVYKKKQYSINEIQACLENKSVLIDYHINNKSIDVFIISQNNFVSKQILVKDSLEQLIENYRYTLSEYPNKATFMEKGYENFKTNGSKLYEYLIKPIEPNLKDKNKLVIIVDKALSLLPFETLYCTENKEIKNDLATLDYLIKKYEIVYNYSCNLWVNSTKRSDVYKKQPNSFLGMAPVFDKKKMNEFFNTEYITSNNRMNVNAFSELSELPATARAINEIHNFATEKGLSSKKFLYEKATKYNFINSVKNNKYVLIATHGKVSYQNSYLSGLYFMPPKTDHIKNEEYFLFSDETYNLNLSSDLLILYACETGVGKINKGEGVMSISRGYISSGSANIIHSLWSIQDVSTKDLIVNTFKSIFDQNSYALSIRQAKLEMINYGIPPFHWAGLVLIGN